MKRISILFFFLYALACSLLGQTTYENEYYCGFETKELFDSTWKTFDIDGTKWTWQSGKYIELWTSNGWPGEPDHNSWMISPKVNITNAENLCVRLMIHSGLSQESLKITMGKQADEASQTIVLKDWNTCFTRTDNPEYYIFDLPADLEPGEYYFGIQGYSLSMSSYIHIYSFELLKNDFYTVSGILKNDKDEILKGAQVKISGEKYKQRISVTDENGRYSFDKLSPGEFNLNIDIENHESFTETIKVEGSDMTKDIVLKYRFRGSVSGKVVDSNEQPIKKANVTVFADQIYNTETDDEGAFIVENVLGSQDDYSIRIEKELKKTYTRTFNLIDSPVDLGTISMETNVVEPKAIDVVETQQGNFVSWMLPLKETELRYDTGEYYGQIVVKGGDKAAIGVRFNQPIILNGLKWVMTSDYQQETVGVCVFALDKNGDITKDILYEASDIPVLKYDFDGNIKWTEYLFTENIEADYGCLAVVYGKDLYMAHDSGQNPEYPFSYQYFVANDYLTDDYVNTKFNGNILFRGLGYTLGVPQNLSKLLKSRAALLKSESETQSENVTYSIWRLNEEQYNNRETAQEGWEALASGLNVTNYLDVSFKNIAQGNYYYAINATYDDGQVSEYAYSDAVERNMRTQLTFNVFTKLGTGLVDGALVKIQNKEDESCIYLATVNNETAIIKDVKKGTYSISIECKGFEPINDEVKFVSDNSYTRSYEMTFIPESPVNLKVEQSGNDVLLSWNNLEYIKEDFEGMADFSINEPGEIGWEYIDADEAKTYEFAEVTEPFKNMGEAMAFMVFNPSQTKPSLFKYVKPYSGNKVLVDIAIDASMSSGKHNDDYIFSPELSFEDNFVFSFYAISGYSGQVAGNEQFMAGYTKGEVSTENIVWFDNEVQEVGGQWTLFKYEVPKDAKRVVLRCVSDNKFMFAVDDIYIGYEKTKAQDIATYDVYIDEELIGQTASNNYKVSNLETGSHIAKVQAIYNNIDGSVIYSDEKEVIFEVSEESGIKQYNVTGEFEYNDNTKTIKASGAESILVFNAGGIIVAEYNNLSDVCIDGLQPGMYIVSVKCNNQTNNYKIVVK